MCNNNVTCVSNVCACGGAGQACCPGGMEAAAGCSSPLQCAGITCSCLVACNGGLVQRTDGSLWSSSTVPVTTGTGAKFIATSFSSGGSLSCGVQSDGSAWCWGSNSYGQLGIGNVMPTSSTLPVKVVTDMSGTPLANVVNVFVEPYNSYSACAIDKNGAAWCWGYGYYGQLGTGYTNNSLFATPVTLTPGGAQITGVDQISISNDHACARKTDMSLWCWGSNQYGQIGVGADPMTTPHFLNPVQVTALFNNVVNVTVGGTASCATTNDGSVYCWGSNSQGVLGNGLNTGFANVPAQVLTAGDAGAAFTGAMQVQLMYYGYAACALKTADHSIWCWGSYSSAQKYFPVPYTEMMFPISNVFVLCGDQPNSGSPSFIDAKSAFHQSGYLQNPQVPCQ
jgi:Regulator of chromosome condensation (RCC1) repeat